jgi:hypothetical protein
VLKSRQGLSGEKMRKLLVLMFLMLSVAGARADHLPTSFLGNWNGGEITISPTSIRGQKWGCNFKSIKVLSNGAVVINMDCSAEQSRYKNQEMWAIQKIENKEVLIMADSKGINVLYRD